MNFRILLPVLSLLFLTLPAAAGDDKATAKLKELQARVARQDFQNDQLRRELLAFCREQVGTPLYAKGIDALGAVPSPLDRLDAKEIDEEDRKFLSIRDLVAFIRPHDRAIASVAISFDGSFLASSSWDNSVHVYKLGGKEPKSWGKLDGSASGIAFSPDSKLLAAGCADTRVLLWDLTGEKPKQKHALAGHKNRPFSIAFSPTGKMLVSGCYDPILRHLEARRSRSRSVGRPRQRADAVAGPVVARLQPQRQIHRRGEPHRQGDAAHLGRQRRSSWTRKCRRGPRPASSLAR